MMQMIRDQQKQQYEQVRERQAQKKRGNMSTLGQINDYDSKQAQARFDQQVMGTNMDS